MDSQRRNQSPTSATQGDGGIYSNLEDLAKWVAALESHTLLSENEMRPALTPVTLNDGSQPHWPVDANDDNLHPGQPVAYGFGWFLDPFKGRARMWHTGGTMGFRTVIERFTGEKLTVVVLCNRTDLVSGEAGVTGKLCYLRSQLYCLIACRNSCSNATKAGRARRGLKSSINSAILCVIAATLSLAFRRAPTSLYDER